MPETTIQLVEREIKLVETEGFGEVTIKIKNGVVYRIVHTVDRLLDNKQNKE